jgi:hypothetical protein
VTANRCSEVSPRAAARMEWLCATFQFPTSTIQACLHDCSRVERGAWSGRAAYRTVLRPAFSKRANYRGKLANALLAASPVRIDKLTSKWLNKGMQRICSAESCQDRELCPSPDVAQRGHVECSNSVTLIQSLAVRIGQPCESVSAKQSAQ